MKDDTIDPLDLTEADLTRLEEFVAEEGSFRIRRDSHRLS
jgi:hypothetical protein